MNVSDLANISLFVLVAAAVLAAGIGAVIGRMRDSARTGIVVLCGGIAVTAIALWCIWAWMPTLYATAPHDDAATTLGDMLAQNLWVLPGIGILTAALAYLVYFCSTSDYDFFKE